MTETNDRIRLGSGLTMEALYVGYGKEDVLRDIGLSVATGEFLSLLGPSGCGKSTLLRAVAGFIPLRSGDIRLDGQSIIDLPPEKRGMAMMFQSYALWPHMTVEQNVGYGLRLRGIPRRKVAEKVNDMLKLVGLQDFRDRKPGFLSGGQRQRVALARALSVDPPVLLLDEPLSNLDAGIRTTMRHEIRSLQQRLGLTTIMVTHDQSEAMSMADRIVVLENGSIAQIGAPEDIYHRPATPYVAQFMGAGNELPVTLTEENGARVLKPRNRSAGSDQPYRLMFRSDAARICLSGEARPDGFLVTGTVVAHNYLGSVYRHTLDVDVRQVMVDHRQKLHVGMSVDMLIPATAGNLFAMSATAAAGSQAETRVSLTQAESK